MSESTLVVCSECGRGNFLRFDAAASVVRGVVTDVFKCTECGTEVTLADFEGNESEGESLVIANGVLTVVSES